MFPRPPFVKLEHPLSHFTLAFLKKTRSVVLKNASQSGFVCFLVVLFILFLKTHKDFRFEAVHKYTRKQWNNSNFYKAKSVEIQMKKIRSSKRRKGLFQNRMDIKSYSYSSWANSRLSFLVTQRNFHLLMSKVYMNSLTAFPVLMS